MSHTPKLSIYKLTIKAKKNGIENSLRSLILHKTGEINSKEKIHDSFLMTEILRLFIESLDKKEMYADEKSKKVLTANQKGLEEDDVDTNIKVYSKKNIIEGVIEGGKYGKKRKRRSTKDKYDKSNVSEFDAITDDFYFLIYIPLDSNKVTLMIQSYSDDNIDNIFKQFWSDFFSTSEQFSKPKVERFIPNSLINKFKNNSTVSSLTFTTEMPGTTLLDKAIIELEQTFKVTIQISTKEDGLSMNDFDKAIEPIQNIYFTKLRNLLSFNTKKGVLRNKETKATTPFTLGNTFDIQPTIILSDYVKITNTDQDFENIKEYCLKLLEEIKPEIYVTNGFQER